MKIREGFVSNSSSTSFIVRGKNDIKKAKELPDNSPYGDFVVVGGKLYSSPLPDGDISVADMFELETQTNEGCSYGGPIDDKMYVEMEGELGKDQVFVPLKDMHFMKWRIFFYRVYVAFCETILGKTLADQYCEENENDDEDEEENDD